MNGKQAKRLRRAAESASVGQPRREYDDCWFTRVYKVMNLKGEMEPRTYQVYTRRLVENCTRAVYQRVKGAA